MTKIKINLPDDLHFQLNQKALSLSVSKDELVASGIRLYLTAIEKWEYTNSYKAAGGDVELLAIADEGMGDYLRGLDCVGG